MKVFLDDVRTPPPGWLLVKTPEGAIKLLEQGQVTLISLDHDLGFDDIGDGYTVLLWIEQQVVLNGFKPPFIWVHSDNAGAVPRMIQAIRSINNRIAREQPRVQWDSRRDTPPED